MAAGHVRYSTTGETALRNVQPLFAELASGGFAIAHNGNFTNGLTLRRQIIATGGRVLTCTGRGPTLAEAHRRAYAQVDAIDWPQGFCRRDIGWRAL